ncbi:uncharacterized protein LOC115095024 [Rhinatrema bivittatum]|uniref:uncharacterized protein LOC115095024 n=1 Tax=Rhinatrema bivittatum TaxID=194408 RepID=UPI0011264ACD|nr:uncharacterized protein LOC115095024 [Rhinatrema bivittatum]
MRDGWTEFPGWRGLLEDYTAFYEASWLEGRVLICNEPVLKEKAKERLGSTSWTGEGFKVLDFYGIVEGCLKSREEQVGEVLKKLMKALEMLELICVNLFLSPWRKEIRTLKTFTGNFVYFVQSVLPEHTLKNVLRKIGYMEKKATEFSVVETINEQKTKETAFEIFLARNECEVILENMKEGKHCSFLAILQQRSQMYWKNEKNEHKQDQLPPERESLSVASPNSQQAPPCYSPRQNSLSKLELHLKRTGKNKEEYLSEFSPSVVSINQTTERHQENKHQATGSCHMHSKHSDSDEFLKTYSDIIIAKKHIFQEDLSLKRLTKEQTDKACTLKELTRAETNTSRLHFLASSGPQSFAICTKTTSEKSKAAEKYTLKQVTQEVSDDSPFSNTTRDTETSPDPLSSISHEEKKQKENTMSDCTPATELDLTQDHVDHELSSSFSKLKISETNEDYLKFPVEETAQPEPELYRENQDVQLGDPNYTGKCLHSAGSAAPSAEPVASECTSSDSKQLLMEAGPEGFIYVREPPHSVYIPPESLESQPPCAKLMDCHCQRKDSSTQPPSCTDTFPIDNSFFKMEETQETFVVISKQTNPKD